LREYPWGRVQLPKTTAVREAAAFVSKVEYAPTPKVDKNIFQSFLAMTSATHLIRLQVRLVPAA
jgi:hypothetical protein